ncbi:MAG TPA: creatininase family protein [Thermomicrobiales bacterium]|nr:creatininase family protein [Thermomicrobiales bacterium]
MAGQMWNEMTRDEVRAALPEAIVVLPTGATEQHGPHLVTGHDTFAVTDVATRAASLAQGDVIVAPTLPFGSSHHHLPFGGTLSLSTETYRAVVSDLVASMIAGGARRIFLLNGHGGNQELNVLVARDQALQQSAAHPVVIAAASYWQIAEASILATPGMAGIPLPGHAGAFETSTMLACNPDRVRSTFAEREADPSRLPLIPGTRIEASNAWQAFDGFTDFPERATAELGSAVLEVILRDVAAAFDTLANLPIELPS